MEPVTTITGGLVQLEFSRVWTRRPTRVRRAVQFAPRSAMTLAADHFGASCQARLVAQEPKQAGALS